MRTISIIFALILIGCNKEVEPNEPQQTQVDCNCDRVASHTAFNSIGYTFGEYVTINDCSGVQTSGNWNTNWGDVEPTDGECL